MLYLIHHQTLYVPAIPILILPKINLLLVHQHINSESNYIIVVWGHKNRKPFIFPFSIFTFLFFFLILNFLINFNLSKNKSEQKKFFEDLINKKKESSHPTIKWHFNYVIEKETFLILVMVYTLFCSVLFIKQQIKGGNFFVNFLLVLFVFFFFFDFASYCCGEIKTVKDENNIRQSIEFYRQCVAFYLKE